MSKLLFLDAFLTLFHLAIVGFNIFGWIWKKARRVHFVVVMLTAGCWFIPGIWYGIGYCPVTDWQWHVKEQLGERNLPNSFIKYWADKLTSTDVNTQFIDILIAVCFTAAFLLSVYLNFFGRRKDVGTSGG
jgi:hypothetical protein